MQDKHALELTPIAARIIGVLIEKQLTTPDQYPLSLNALTLGCNQKTNREPVMQLSESQVQDSLDELAKRHLVREQSGFGQRVSKYQHRLCNTEFGKRHYTPQQTALLCVLLLRGAQTPGELRTRTQRLCQFQDVHEVETTLDSLCQHPDGPLAYRLAREAGKREIRYMHSYFGEPSDQPTATEAPDTPMPPAPDRIQQLEDRVSQLEQQLEALQQQLTSHPHEGC